MSYNEYTCSRCGAWFGIAGESTGSDEDVAAESHYDGEVEWHESGQCSPPQAAPEALRPDGEGVGMTFVEFLLARIAEDEAVAQSGESWTAQSDDVFGNKRVTVDFGVQDYVTANCRPWRAEHIARWSPSRVLVECGSKRKLIERFIDYESKIDNEWGCCHDARQIAAGGCHLTDWSMLQFMAAPYADHVDYRDEWRVVPPSAGQETAPNPPGFDRS